MRRRIICICLVAVMCFSFSTACALEWLTQAWEDTTDWVSNAADDVGDWVSNAAEDTGEWVSQAVQDTGEWISNAAEDTANWVSQAATDVWDWTSNAATDTWNGVSGFFSPPSSMGNPNVPQEPELPAGVQKMYLGYGTKKMQLDSGFDKEEDMGKDDPHFGMVLGKFYVSGFTDAISEDGKEFTFLKTVGDNVELHFQLAQDIDMLGGDSLVTINRDQGGYDKQFGVKSTDFGRGALIVRFTDFENHTSEPQVYTDYLSAKMSGTADTVISLNEEGTYEVALDYEIRNDTRVLGTSVTTSGFTNYKIAFRFTVRNGNCMIFPFDLVTGEELQNTAVTKNGFRLDLARSRFLSINVKYSAITLGSTGLVEDIRFNRPAADGDEYKQEGIYTITVRNKYTNEETVKTLYVGENERLMSYINQGYTLEQVLEALNSF